MSINVIQQEITAAVAAMGRAAVLIGVDSAYYAGDEVTVDDTQRWDRTGALYLAHLGFTEGDVEPAPEVEMSELTLNEYTGPAVHRRLYSGESVTITIPFYFAEPRLQAIASPVASASAGYSRQRAVDEHTLVLVPEQLLYDTVAKTFEALTWDGVNGWRVGGAALTEEQERLLGLSMWCWRGSFGRQLPAFAHADGGKVIVPVEFTIMYSSEFPDGHRMYTRGDPAAAGIDLDGGV